MMTVRFRKKVRKLRGSKTHGWGAKKKHRGGGSRAGRGMGGRWGPKATAWLPEYFRPRKGFKIQPEQKRPVKAITLKDVDALARKLNIKEIDLGVLGYGRVLGTGKITQALTVRAPVIVKRAKERIAAAGGTAIETAAFPREGI